MRTTSAIVCALFVTLAVTGATGCREKQSSVQGGNEQASTKGDLALRDLSAKAGIVFPTNTVLINADGDGRNPNFSFYVWALFSPTEIKMPMTKAPGVEFYLNLPLEDTVDFVQRMMRKGKISQAQSAFSSEWETNGYTFRGTVVRSPEGDHLVIEQFRKK